MAKFSRTFALLFSLVLSLSLFTHFSPPQLVEELLLHEGQAMSVGLSAETGHGGQWLAHIAQLLQQRSVTDVTVVPVGISYDRVPDAGTQVEIHKHQVAFRSKGDKGSVQVLHNHLSCHWLNTFEICRACFGYGHPPNTLKFGS